MKGLEFAVQSRNRRGFDGIGHIQTGELMNGNPANLVVGVESVGKPSILQISQISRSDKNPGSAGVISNPDSCRLAGVDVGIGEDTGTSPGHGGGFLHDQGLQMKEGLARGLGT